MKAARGTITNGRRVLALFVTFALAGVGMSVGLDAREAASDHARVPEAASAATATDEPRDAIPWDDTISWHDDTEPLATFAVDEDRLDLGPAPRDLAKQASAIWRRFTQLIPADQRTMVDGFELLPAAYGGAHVYPSDRDPHRWIIGIGLGLGDELDATLIHEFGHLLTLRAEEVPPDSDEQGCTTYFTGEGCALTGSTFAGFVERFWPPAMIDRVHELEASGDWEAAGDFYEEHGDRFVTDYATTNPAEDLAETFTSFVTGARPSGSTIADQKLEYLWSDPDMVTLRSRIRAGLGAT